MAAAAVLMAAACTAELSTEKIESSEKCPLAEGSDARIEIQIDVEYPTSGPGKQALAAIRDTITARLFGEGFEGMTPAEAVESYKQKTVSEYKELNMPLLEESEGMPTASLSWDDYTYGKFTGSHGKIISYSVTRYVYTGGAHGMTAESALNFNRQTGALLSEDDFFKEGYQDRLRTLLSDHLAESLDEPADTSMLFTREIGPNGNFRISDDGVTYIYNQYEIAPYAMGVISVTIPWNELEGLTNE